MIKINPQKLVELSQIYISQIMPIIQQKYNILKEKNVMNPFTNEPVVNFFENNKGELDIEFVKIILIDPFSQRAKRVYPQLDYYFKTAALAFYDDNFLRWHAKQKGIKKGGLPQLREEKVQNLKNPWIELDILDSGYSEYKKNWIEYKKLTNHITKKLEQFHKAIKEFIDYSFMTEDIRHNLLCGLEIRVCPYCNRQYITTYNKNGEKLRSTSDLDHFYPKVAFQLYSLSLFNFIPACSICNSRFKRAKKLKILYLYEMGFEDRVTFKVKPTSISNINSLIGNNSDFDLVLEVDNAHANNDELQGHIEMFRLEEVYQSHKDFVQELLYKRKAYSSAYKEMTEQLLNTRLSEEEFNLFLFGVMGNEKDLLNKPLSKLTIDILGLRK
ncbi:hypothetical protein P9Z39_28010 [Bacillus thuringiensis]|uniref:hypothetical protein n=1 Tax=Bacillus thuringiensis TaxID=1428 RepID=UPI000A37F9D9|nr:hypothetical protein [Bacillus thuringiensis]MEC2709472.1 hypothetical protein [Bacillus thuringiensis]OUB69073.1 hypothetical protein BK765_18855 [Bacillus thuringiensis serovar dakota]